MRIILFTGKGGVGKTSVAAASALRAASLGHKTVVFSTDAAHSLADSLDLPLGPKPVQVAPNLWGQEIDVYEEIKQHWGTVQEWLTALMAWHGVEEIVAEEMAILPGMEELVSLLHIVDYQERGEYDLAVVDCAPTGETLRLLSFPDMARWYMERLFPVERKAASLVRPILRPFLNIPFPGEAVFDAIQDLFQRLERMRNTLADRETTSVRLVVNPEKMVIKETQRTFTYLNLYGYNTDLVICNRLLSAEITDDFFTPWKDAQEKYYRFIDEAFSPVPVRGIPLFSQEAVGLEMLGKMAEALYGEEDPAKLFFHGVAQELTKVDGSYVLALPLPFVSKEELSILQSGDEVVIQAGKYRRNIFLPRPLVGLPVAEARFQDNRLQLRFGGGEDRVKKKKGRSSRKEDA